MQRMLCLFKQELVTRWTEIRKSKDRQKNSQKRALVQNQKQRIKSTEEQAGIVDEKQIKSQYHKTDGQINKREKAKSKTKWGRIQDLN